MVLLVLCCVLCCHCWLAPRGLRAEPYVAQPETLPGFVRCCAVHAWQVLNRHMCRHAYTWYWELYRDGIVECNAAQAQSVWHCHCLFAIYQSLPWPRVCAHVQINSCGNVVDSICACEEQHMRHPVAHDSQHVFSCTTDLGLHQLQTPGAQADAVQQPLCDNLTCCTFTQLQPAVGAIAGLAACCSCRDAVG